MLTRLAALTLWRPVDHWMADGAKPIENRKQPPPRTVMGRLLALHSGQHYDQELEAWIRGRFPDLVWPAEPGPAGFIVTVVRVVGVLPPDVGRAQHVLPLALPPWWRPEDSRWKMEDRFGWIVTAPDGGRPRRLARPVPAMGHQGLWYCDDSQLAQIREQIGSIE